MHLHSAIISFNRLDLLKQCYHSYKETVSVPYTLVIVDNRSDNSTRQWLSREVSPHDKVIFLEHNRFPGYACNRGWETMPEETTLLHRSDNDFVFLPKWCDEVIRMFEQYPKLGQIGLRTGEEELYNGHNVGGNNVIRRKLWDAGLRYDERTWPQIAAKVPGYTEDSFFSPRVKKMGWEWGRVQQSCIRPISNEDPTHPDFDREYYERTWADRGIER